jgi:Flp pilus assembly protein TadD
MSFWSRFSGGKPKNEQKRLDYLSEGLALERQGDYEAALTSYALALRDQPTNHRVLQNMAIAYSRTGRTSEAIRCYRRALEIQPKLSGAHYGLAFLLLRRGEVDNAAFHLESFLMDPPAPSAEADRWIRHARETLERLRTTDDPRTAEELKGEEYPEVSD